MQLQFCMRFVTKQNGLECEKHNKIRLYVTTTKATYKVTLVVAVRLECD
jgi:hypothetical protein